MRTIPFKEDSEFREEIELDEELFFLNFKWNALKEYWTMSIFDSDLNPIIFSIKVVTQWNLTEQIVKLNMPNGEILCQNIVGTFEKIKRDDIGRTNKLIFWSEDEL
jgi:hypothetical protein